MRKIIIILIMISIVTIGFAQIINYGKNFKINENEVRWSMGSPVLTQLSNGNLVICWENDYGTIVGRIYNSKLNSISSELIFFGNNTSSLSKHQRITKTTGTYDHSYEILALKNGNFVIFFQNHPLKGRIFDENGGYKNIEIQIPVPPSEHDIIGADHPSLTLLNNGNFVVCWHYGPVYGATRSGDSKGIYLQLFDQYGDNVSDTIKVNDFENYDEWNPTITTLNDSRFVVCWQNGYGYSKSNIYGQIFNNSGIQVSDEFKISTGNSNFNHNPYIQAFKSGTFFVVWSHRKNYEYSLKGHLYSSAGMKIKELSIPIYDPIPTFSQLDNGNLVICWGALYGQLFDETLTKIDEKFRIGISRNEHHQVHSFEKGFITCWLDCNENIVGKYYLQEPIMHSLENFNIISPKMDKTLYSIQPKFLWHKANKNHINFPWEMNYELYLSKNNDFEDKIIYNNINDTTFQIPDTLETGQTYFWKVLAKNLEGDSLWSSNVNGFYVSEDATDVEKNKSIIPEKFKLHQNYPNPFNPVTNIAYDLPPGSDQYKVMIKIYDLRGNLVKMLENSEKVPGHYIVQWNGTDQSGHKVSNGMYIYSITAGKFKASGKMLSIK